MFRPEALLHSQYSLFSPRARGCSFALFCGAFHNQGFPRVRGDVAWTRPFGRILTGFSRVRGDVPRSITFKRRAGAFSPRARGCSAKHGALTKAATVFPACAGMFPLRVCGFFRGYRFPRVRGDVPIFDPRSCLPRTFSPRARGCSPPRRRLHLQSLRFSPRARGCSEAFFRGGHEGVVFPACAGMFRCSHLVIQLPLSFPRVRGDVPCRPYQTRRNPGFSPRARGCSYNFFHIESGSRSRNQVKTDNKEDDITKWLKSQGAKDVRKLCRFVELPADTQKQVAEEVGHRRSPDFLADGILLDGKTISGPKGIKNNAKSGAKQAKNIIFDLRQAGSVDEEEIVSCLKNAIRDQGNKLDRMIVVSQNKTYLWERKI